MLHRIACLPLSLTLCLLPAAAALAQTVQRCEGDGRVVYSDAECPPGTRPVRELNTAPAVRAGELKAAQERNRRDARQLKDLEQKRATEQQAAAEKSAQREQQAKERQLHCTRLEMRARHLREDAQAATLDRRPALERKQRQAQEQFEAQCGKS